MTPFDRNSINEYLANPLNLEEGETDSFSRRMHQGTWNIGRISRAILTRGRTVMKNTVGIPTKFKNKDMTTRAQVALTLTLNNIRPHSHTSTIPVESYYLIYYLVDGRDVDVAQIIANEIKTIAEIST